MRTVWTVALITLKESLRHKVLYGILICALLVMVSSLLISGLFMRDIIKVTLDLCLSAVSIGGLLVPFFLTINLLARDIENKTIYTLLAGAISRQTYILWKISWPLVVDLYDHGNPYLLYPANRQRSNISYMLNTSLSI